MSQPEQLSLIVGGSPAVYEADDFKPDGVTLDTTEALSLLSSAPTIATVAFVPGEARKFAITAVAGGTATITINAPGVPPGAGETIAVIVETPPNLSHIAIRRLS